MMAYRR